MSRVAVIGGGLSGLAAALRLQDGGCDGVVLLEKSRRLGGLIETVRQDGFLIERGADSFITTKPAGVAWVERLGLGDRLIGTRERNRRSLIVRGGRTYGTPADFHLCVPRNVQAVLDSPLLSTAGKLRFLREAAIPPHAAGGDESLASFAVRRFGRETLDRIIQPICAGIYSADPSQLSMQATMPQFLAMERQHASLIAAGVAARRQDSESASGARYGLFASFPNGLSELIDAAAAALTDVDVQTGVTVKSAAATTDGWRLQFEETRPQLTVEAVVLAVSAPVVAAILGVAAGELARVPYASSVIVASGYRLEEIGHPLNAFGMVVPTVEGRPVTAVSFASRKFHGRAPDGCVLIRTFLGGPHGRAILRDAAACRDAASTQLRELLDVRGEPLTTLVSPYLDASPQYVVGHRDRVERIRCEIAEQPRLEIAGTSLTGVGIPDAITAGQRAAEDVLRSL